jgi:hypothetical protein
LCLGSIISIEAIESQEKDLQIKRALHILAPDESEYGYISKNIREVTINDSRVEFHASVKILKFQSKSPGIVLQIDARGIIHSEESSYGLTSSKDELRYAFRLATDGSVIFYYPFMDSSAAVTVKDGWKVGEWCHLAIIVDTDSAKFHINGVLVDESDNELSPKAGGFYVSKIGMGKTDKLRRGMEAFITRVLLVKDGSNIFSENFEDNLESYEIKKSSNAIVQVIDLVRFTNIEAFSSLKSIPSGDSTLLRARLLDSSLNGISNKTIIFEYQFNDIWVDIGESQTDYNGTTEFNWKVPSDLQGYISIRSIFSGDTDFAESQSKNLLLQVTIKSGPKIETFIIIFSILTMGLVGITFLFYRLGRIKFLSILLPIICSISLFFSLPILANAFEIQTYVAYEPTTVSLQIFDTQIDRIIWLSSSIIMAISWMVLYTRKLLERKITALPIISMILSIALVLLGIDHVGSFFAFLSPILVAFTPLLIHNRRELTDSIDFVILFLISFLSIIFLIEVGSALGWAYNSLDPHVPFDGDPRWILPSLEANLIGVLYPLALPAFIVLVFSWAWIPILDKFYRSFVEQYTENAMEKTKHYLNSQKQENRISRDNHYKYLPLLVIPIIILTSFFLVYYPYFYTPRLIGVDTPWYYENLLSISSSEGIQHVISDYGAVTRMPYLLILYALMTVFSLPPMIIVKIGPAIPATLMGISSFYFTRTLTRNDFIATISAFLGLFSIATTVGIFAGVYANWLALGLVLIFWTLLLKLWENPSSLILVTVISSFLILITHPWTWAIILASLAAYLMFNLIFHRSDNSVSSQKITANKSTLIVLGINFVLLVILLAVFFSGEFIRLSTEVFAAMNTKYLTQFLGVMTYSLRFYVGGFLANTIIIILCILGLFTIKNLKRQFYAVFISLLLVAFVPLLLLDSWWQWRLLYMIPYNIPATLFLFYALDASKKSGIRYAFISTILFSLIIVLSSFNYALRCLNYIPG